MTHPNRLTSATAAAHSGPGKLGDRPRQILVAVFAVVATIGAFIGSGVIIGTPIAEAADGALSANATLLSPGTPAFRIWSVIYLGFFAYAIWQFLPRNTQESRHRRLGLLVVFSMVLNAAWILVVQAGLLWLSVVVIALLLVTLCLILRILVQHRPTSLIDAIVTDGTFGLYIGWVTIATIANITSALVASGFDGWNLSPTSWAIVVLAAAALIGGSFAAWTRGKFAPTLALAWGLVWVASERAWGEPHNDTVAIAALTVAIAILVATAVIKLRVVRRDRDLKHQ
ncbi:tryptophan-rich sensory protein [Humidisolicoccus flavus]|uniref:tryptophan-rich sensory protein n=1 Tax=Humidisolicoccus flavus TaxID=3111414 RepID=UPI00324D2568